jgi:ribosome maturation factor RimP
MYKDELKKEIKEIAQEFINAANAELVHCEVRPQNRTMLIRFLVDKPEGISIDECVLISRAIEREIDAKGLFTKGYTLEVASPGLDRLLKTQADFHRVLGKEVVMTYDTGGNHIEKIEGIIVDALEDSIKINLKDRIEIIEYSSIKKAKQKIKI